MATKTKKQSGKVKRTLAWLKPTTPAKGVLLFALVFGLGGGVYYSLRSSAASTTTIGGIVYSPTGTRVAGAKVIDCTGKTAVTNSNGRFVFSENVMGLYCVRVLSLPAQYQGMVAKAVNNQPEHATDSTYEWQVAAANCYHNLVNCGNGKIGGYDQVLTRDLSVSTEINHNFRIRKQ